MLRRVLRGVDGAEMPEARGIIGISDTVRLAALLLVEEAMGRVALEGGERFRWNGLDGLGSVVKRVL